MEFTAQQIAEVIQGQIEGDPDTRVSKLAKIEEGKKGDLSFLSNQKYTPYLYSTEASIVLVNQSFKAEKSFKATLIRVEDSYVAFGKLLEFYDQAKKPVAGISALSSVSASAQIGVNVYVGDFTVIESNVHIGENSHIYPQVYIGADVKIGSNATIYPGVKIYGECIIGNHCTIHAGTIIGADGFGFAPQGEAYTKLPQIGNVIIEDQVEIGANACIDRATLGSTIIRKGVKLDNLIQVGHNAIIDESTVIAAQSGISGSAKIGKHVMMGGQVGIVGHLKVGDKAMIAAQSGVSSNVKEGSVVMGSPSMEIGHYKKSYVLFRNLVRIVQRLDQLEKILKEKIGK